MKRTAVGFAILGLALSGCNGGDTQEEELEAQAQAQGGQSADLYFSYPAKGQAGFPTSAPMILRFGSEITTPEEEVGPGNFLIDKKGSGEDSWTDVDPGRLDVEIVGDGRTLKVDRVQGFEPGARYRLVVSGISLGGELMELDGPIEFTTAASRTGPVSHRVDGAAENLDDFGVARVLPFSADIAGQELGDGSDTFPLTNKSTLRIQFTQPVDENVISDETVQVLDSNGEAVETEILTRGNLLTVDPEGILKAGETYELVLNGVESSLGDGAINDETWTFTPVEARPVAEDGTLLESTPLVQEAVQGGSDDTVALTGKEYNSVILGATTLGQGNKTVQTGIVNAYLGDLQRFESESRAIPLTVDRGTLMKGTSVDVLVGGELQTAFKESGDIDVRFLSDANGYMIPNPYSDSSGAPRHVRLFADLAMNTENAKANGSLAQELLHVELLGTVAIEDGRLSLEAVSVIEPDVLGIDKASGLISFRLEAFNDPEKAPEPITDNSGPQLKAWTPGEDHQDKLQPQDSITLLFDEPLLPSSVNERTVTLNDGNKPVPVDIRLNGPNVIVDPRESLSYGASYNLNVSGVSDLAGDPLESGPLGLGFSLPATADAETPTLVMEEESTAVGPLVLTTRPGYPCAKTDLSSDPSENNGRCLGGITSNYSSDEFPDRNMDDFLPVEKHPSDEPLIVRFSQDIRPESVTKDTVIVERSTGPGSNDWKNINDQVRLEANAREIRVIPNSEWGDESDLSNDEKTDFTYRYRLKSHPNPDPGVNSIVAEYKRSDGSYVPIYTKILSQFPSNAASDGGRPIADLQTGGNAEKGYAIENRFKLREPNTNLLTPLSNLATADANGNLSLDGEESIHVPDIDVPNVVLGDEGEDPSEVDTHLRDKLGPDKAQDFPQNSAAMQMIDVESEVVGSGAVGCSVDSGSECPAEKKMIYKTAKLDVETAPDAESRYSGEEGVPVKLDPSVLHTSSSDVWIQLDNEVLSLLATGEPDPNVRVPTGPMVMRMRYQGSDRDGQIDGLIYSENGELRFKTELDVYLDAPYLVSQLSGALGVTTTLEDNMRSLKIDDLKLDGPIKFFEDGRMQIQQRNVGRKILDVVLRGEIEVVSEDEYECSLSDGYEFGDLTECVLDAGEELTAELGDAIIGSGANMLLDVNTNMTLAIPKNAIHLNYITPYTQKRE